MDTEIFCLYFLLVLALLKATDRGRNHCVFHIRMYIEGCQAELTAHAPTAVDTRGFASRAR